MADIGAAFLSADLSITRDVWEDHASYIGHWLRVLKDDKRFIFSAAAHRSEPRTTCTAFQPKTHEAHQAAA